MVFSASDVEVIKRFLTWVVEARDEDEGVTGFSDEGVTFTEWDTEYEYGDSHLCHKDIFVPWVALTDPDEYDRMVKEQEKAAQREREANAAAEIKRREAHERATFEQLRKKYG